MIWQGTKVGTESPCFHNGPPQGLECFGYRILNVLVSIYSSNKNKYFHLHVACLQKRDF